MRVSGRSYWAILITLASKPTPDPITKLKFPTVHRLFGLLRSAKMMHCHIPVQCRIRLVRLMIFMLEMGGENGSSIVILRYGKPLFRASLVWMVLVLTVTFGRLVTIKWRKRNHSVRKCRASENYRKGAICYVLKSNCFVDGSIIISSSFALVSEYCFGGYSQDWYCCLGGFPLVGVGRLWDKSQVN